MKNRVYLVATLTTLQGCIVAPTKMGEAIRLVNRQSDYNCRYIETVTGSDSLGWTSAHDAEGAMNEAKNRSAKIGANAIRIINIDSDLATSVVVAEDLKCDFKDKNN